jgi:hypothetical protein
MWELSRSAKIAIIVLGIAIFAALAYKPRLDKAVLGGQCQLLYTRALTAADTLHIDTQVLTDEHGNHTSCGELRRMGAVPAPPGTDRLGGPSN